MSENIIDLIGINLCNKAPLFYVKSKEMCFYERDPDALITCSDPGGEQ